MQFGDPRKREKLQEFQIPNQSVNPIATVMTLIMTISIGIVIAILTVTPTAIAIAMTMTITTRDQRKIGKKIQIK